MALTVTRFLRSTPTAIQSAVEVGGYLVAGTTSGIGQWGAYNLATNTSRVFAGMITSATLAPRFVAYGGYAWTMQGGTLVRLNPVTGGVATAVMSDGSTAPHDSVLVGSVLYVVYNTRRMISIDLSAATPTSTLVAADAGARWEHPPVYGSDGAIWGTSALSPAGIYRFTLTGVATKIGTAPESHTNLIESGGYIYYGAGTNFYRINMATSDWEAFDASTINMTPGSQVAVGSDGRIYGNTFAVFGGLDPATGLTQTESIDSIGRLLRLSSGALWGVSAIPNPWP